MQQLLISDANILIDMEEGGLLEAMFQLPYNFATPDILFYEELEEEHAHLPGLGLALKEVSSESMMYAMQLTGTYTKASRNDCFALALAKQEQCPLLTGDMALRVAAEKEAAIVKGTIWLVVQLVVHQQINIEKARDAYRQMQANGRRLPWQMAEQALAELEQEQ
ncbi:PIN domain-containing protein [Salinivibrio kushneri]|uniref:PIN domain-containing protein n=1 Tax=Salinivibrio kushneri TaxID=1908198 RepID=A0AA47KPC3_9GAMM|nr:PIN domain-containing protein [Salinivibrio kushneri]WBA10522.1 PIN domain-containing protein [Salinivibrio kushneri]